MGRQQRNYAVSNANKVGEDQNQSIANMQENDDNVNDSASCMEEDEDNCQVALWKTIHLVTESITTSLKHYSTFTKTTVRLVLLCLYSTYLTYACMYNFEASYIILALTGVTVIVYMYICIRDTKGQYIYERFIEPGFRCLGQKWSYIKWPIMTMIVLGFGLTLVLLTYTNPIQLVSFCGLVILIFISYIFSRHPDKVIWRPVIWGLTLQFLLGMFVLRTYPGFVLFDWLNGVFVRLFGFSSAGVVFLFGENFGEHFFAFAVLPSVIYFSSAISILYYWGVMQIIIQKIAWLMQRTMKTTAIESLNVAGNIFMGPSESSLAIAPYLDVMTRSELHAVMTGGLATVAGSTLGGYILLGIDATHLIAASVMSAPAALAISKLVCPETEQSKLVTEEDVQMPSGIEHNFIEAASNGASTGVRLALNIAANLIAFIALLTLLNGLLGFVGNLVGYQDLSFQLICSYLFMPLAFIMGVEWADCQVVAELIGLKTFLNEFVAYIAMGEYIKNRETGEGPTLSLRSEVIATYALCGFSNISSIGIVLGIINPLAPAKAKEVSTMAVSALYAGSVACFTTACIAGILYVPEDLVHANTTSSSVMSTLY